MVFVTRTRGGKPRVSTHHLAEDTDRVRAALEAVDRAGVVKEPSDWPSKLREQYLSELRRRGLWVYLVEYGKAIANEWGGPA